MNKTLYHVAPKESMDSILQKGILTPKEVNFLIDEGELSSKVLGVSFSNNISNFPNYVSLLENFDMVKIVANKICFARTGRYFHPGFFAIGYAINPVIKSHKEFFDSETVKFINADSFFSEALYQKRIPKEFIERVFGIWTY